MRRLALINRVNIQAGEWVCGSCRFLEQVQNNACCRLLNAALDVSERWVAQRKSECLDAERIAEAMLVLSTTPAPAESPLPPPREPEPR